LTFPFGDADALAKQLRRLMDSAELRKSMAGYSKVFGEEMFSPKKINESIEELYGDILSK